MYLIDPGLCGLFGLGFIFSSSGEFHHFCDRIVLETRASRFNGTIVRFDVLRIRGFDLGDSIWFEPKQTMDLAFLCGAIAFGLKQALDAFLSPFDVRDRADLIKPAGRFDAVEHGVRRLGI